MRLGAVSTQVPFQVRCFALFKNFVRRKLELKLQSQLANLLLIYPIQTMFSAAHPFPYSFHLYLNSAHWIIKRAFPGKKCKSVRKITTKNLRKLYENCRWTHLNIFPFHILLGAIPIPIRWCRNTVFQETIRQSVRSRWWIILVHRQSKKFLVVIVKKIHAALQDGIAEWREPVLLTSERKWLDCG